ncbi:response regulator transcription factor [Marinobacterium sp. YM272]|uniref:response regulator transcription factor n=1 Tax=Marinobacterium sp. YM272 TaxID=3421654 RepID=UPI003D7F7DBA
MPRVLIVDDEANILLSLEFLMQQSGYEVVTAGDAESALEMIRNQLPDLVLLDISLPGMSGFDLLEILRSEETTRTLPVIMLTAHGREIEKEKGMALGANGYITKPFSTRELVARVEALLNPAADSGA